MEKSGEVEMKKDFIVRRSITTVEGKPHVETYSEQELVRCKDCISWTAGRCGAFDIAMGPEDFCSKAYPFVFGRKKDAD